MAETTAIYSENYFGGCPTCGRTDGYANVGREHWFVCKAHKTKWFAGENLFSDWKEEDEKTWEENRKELNGYSTVDPVPMKKPDPAERPDFKSNLTDFMAINWIEGVREPEILEKCRAFVKDMYPEVSEEEFDAAARGILCDIKEKITT